MSGFEVIGVILGGLPLVISCLEYYKAEFEVLEEWWKFQRTFIDLTDDIRFELLRYQKTMVELLEPVISDREILERLSNNPSDPRWTDGSLIHALQTRLGKQQDLFLRIAGKIEDEVQGLKRLMQIKNDKTSTPWIPMASTANRKTLSWHLNRFHICFEKGKHRKVKKIALHNDKLREILHCSSTIIPVLEAKKRSTPVSEFEKFRQNASGVYNALKRHIRCSNNLACAIEPHRIGIILHAGDEGQKLQFLLHTGTLKPSLQKETSTLRGFETEPMPTSSTVLGSFPNATIDSFKSHEETIRAAQVSFQDSYESVDVTSANGFEAPNPFRAYIGSSGKKTKSSFKAFFSGARKKPIEKPRFALPRQQVSALDIIPKPELEDGFSDVGKSMPGTIPAQHITDFCLVMDSINVLPTSKACNADSSEELGLISDDADHCYKLLRNVTLRYGSGHRSGRRFLPETTKLARITELLPVAASGAVSLERNQRMKMAAQVAAAFLQVSPSPWLSLSDWSLKDFLFLTTDDHQLFSENPCVFQQLDINLPGDRTSLQQESDPMLEPRVTYHGDEKLPPAVLEKVTRESLFKLGVMLTELLFGKAIFTSKDSETISYEEVFPWVDKIEGEAGPALAEAVKRCVYCNFAPPRDFGDRRFRELVFEGVVKPFREALLPWKT